MISTISLLENNDSEACDGVWQIGHLLVVTMLRAPVCENQTNSKFCGKGRKFDFFHILMLDRLGHN